MLKKLFLKWHLFLRAWHCRSRTSWLAVLFWRQFNDIVSQQISSQWWWLSVNRNQILILSIQRCSQISSLLEVDQTISAQDRKPWPGCSLTEKLNFHIAFVFYPFPPTPIIQRDIIEGFSTPCAPRLWTQSSPGLRSPYCRMSLYPRQLLPMIISSYRKKGKKRKYSIDTMVSWLVVSCRKPRLRYPEKRYKIH